MVFGMPRTVHSVPLGACFRVLTWHRAARRPGRSLSPNTTPACANAPEAIHKVYTPQDRHTASMGRGILLIPDIRRP
jgi:hypothetical protein